MKGIHLALIPAVTLASGTIRWEKFNQCLDRDVLSDELQGEYFSRNSVIIKLLFD